MKASLTGDIVAVKQLLTDGADVNARNADGNTAVWLACYSDSPEIIELLAAHGADLNNQNPDGATALIYASSAGKTNSVHCLLALGADSSIETRDGFTALELSANLPVMKLLRKARGNRGAG